MTSDPVQLLIEAGAIPANPFARTAATATSRSARYARRRRSRRAVRAAPLHPAAARHRGRREHIVPSGERPDMLAAQALGDPELYWRIADANAVTDPFELTDTLGARVAIPLPPGL